MRSSWMLGYMYGVIAGMRCVRLAKDKHEDLDKLELWFLRQIEDEQRQGN